MIYVVTALFIEAKPWIQLYSLKRDPTQKHFQLFYNDTMRLIISQPGKVNAAIAVTELFHHTPPTPRDILINIGVAASCQSHLPMGSGYLIHKITDHDTGRDYYPDIIFQHDFNEASLATYSQVADNSDCQLEANDLIDMEASGIYTAAIHYLKSHQIMFFKCISDNGGTNDLTPEFVSQLIAGHIPDLCQYACQISKGLAQQSDYELSEEELRLIEQLTDQLYFSVTMSHQFRQLLLYAKLTGTNLSLYLTKLSEELMIQPCHSKKEGKEYLERIRCELL